MPLASVVIPVFNQERFIDEAIQSVLVQTIADVELIVVDDGSTDRTPGIVRSYGDRLTLIRQENAGASSALNTGIRAAHGDLVAWLSSDDVYLPNKLRLQLEVFERRPEVALVYTDFIAINGLGETIRTVRSPYYADRRQFIRQLILGNFVNGSSVLARRDAILEAGLFDVEMRYHADANMWLRLLKRHDFGHVPEILLKYRWHPGSASTDAAGMARYRALYYDKIWETLRPEDVLDPAARAGGPLSDRFEAFERQALVANGLFDRARARAGTGIRSVPRRLALAAAEAREKARAAAWRRNWRQ